MCEVNERVLLGDARTVTMSTGRNGASGPDTDVATALRTWRDGLVNLTSTNRALNFKPSKSGTVAIGSPSLAEIFEGLRAGKTWQFDGEPNVDPVTGEPLPHPELTGPYVLHCRKPEKDLGAALRNLSRSRTRLMTVTT